MVKVGGKSIFYRKFYEKGIIFVHDILNENGQLYDTSYFNDYLGIHTFFTEVQGLINVINTLKRNISVQENICRPIIPPSIKLLLSDKKGCQRIYKILSKNEECPIAQIKWQNEILLPENFKWHKAYSLPYKLTNDTQLRWFQYRLSHRILATNTFLNKIGIKDHNKCSFCKTHPETLRHLFWDCDIVTTFWHDLQNWLMGECAHIVNLNLTIKDVILGVQNKQRADEILNFILLRAKSFIYSTKCSNSSPQIHAFKKYLLSHYNTEKYSAFSNCLWDKFNKRWMLYKVLFNHNS